MADPLRIAPVNRREDVDAENPNRRCAEVQVPHVLWVQLLFGLSDWIGVRRNPWLRPSRHSASTFERITGHRREEP
jgi:hypothetical protein